MTKNQFISDYITVTAQVLPCNIKKIQVPTLVPLLKFCHETIRKNQ